MNIDIDDVKAVGAVDKSHMLHHIHDLPDSMASAMKVARPSLDMRPHTIVIAGMGGSAISGDIMADVARPTRCPPIIVSRDYFVPGYVAEGTLVLIVSFSGNTEETLSSYVDAKEKGATIVCVTTGGRLADVARRDEVPIITLKGEKGIAPRAAVGHMLVPSLMLLEDLGCISAEAQIEEAIEVLKGMRSRLAKDVKTKENEAKDIAKSLDGRYPVVLAPNHLATAARRWQTQLNENAKVMARWGVLPEMDHNDIVAWSEMTASGRGRRVAAGCISPIPVLLRDPEGEDRLMLKKRMEVTKMMALGKDVIEIHSEGNGHLARMMSLIYVGDHASTYLAVMNGIDPTPVTSIEKLKKELAK